MGLVDTTIVSVQDIHKRFGENNVLQGATISFPKGKITAIIGQSGTGKSVLIKTIIGVLTPDRGQIFYEGEEITAAPPERRRMIRRNFGYLFQDSALFDSMNVYDNIAFPLVETLRMKDKRQIRRIVEEKLEWIGLPGIERKLPAELSGGMRKRVGLARTLALQPSVLLFDEPTTGLDPVLSESINDLIVRVNQEFGITCILITHDIQATFRISDYIGFLYDGVIQEEGIPGDLAGAEHPVLKKFIDNSFSAPLEVEVQPCPDI
ncbi:ABC transporter ATP-binding protein [Alkalispirochaeta sphaeroplastigenens]|uniref:ABC transporter ATP-binding protein n=1 Tax=Alkalispirochaeta sphaeroplastigenens TaxID=1187066 RepID=A0A2S4JUB2_9SPIO|nr:ATP-binding cassette domain-containing protein [Alkalispirochaeta sphaeroplastigenens]POR03106.1 ABC transporter ATP-binding protein [Alkalispirochaeta sphaeroplastigenens]